MEEGDGLPASICLSCNHLLDMSYDFRCQIQDSDVKLRQILKSQVQSVLHDKHAKDVSTMVKHIITNLSNVASCEKNNHVEEQKIYSHHIVTFDNTTIQSDAIINNESCIENEFMQKTEEIAEPNGKDAQYEVLKENVHNTEIEVALCHEAHMDVLNEQSNRLSESSTEDDSCIKQEQLILPEANETQQSLTNENREEILKIEVKNDVSFEDFDDHDVSKQTSETDNQDMKNVTNCSDDEEKPLISRTIRHHKCLLCMILFPTKGALQRHMIVHKHKHKHKTKLRYVCHVCDKQFSSIGKLKSNVLNSHESCTTECKT